MKLPPDLRAFVESLNAQNAKYVVVGGYAVGYHGNPRFTGDLDLFVEASADNGERAVRAIDQFGFGSLGLKSIDFTEPDSIIQMGYPPNRIDLITSIDAVSFEEAWNSRLPGQLEGLPVYFISRELLIRNKKASGRPKDLGDIASL